MARFARLVIPNYPHHISQRGVRSMDIFPDSQDREAYLSYLKKESARSGMKILAWCLMPNYVHLIVIPLKEDSLTRSPVDYPWSSARYNCGDVDNDHLLRERSLPEMVDNWSASLETTDEEQERMIQKRTKTGRPLGGKQFVKHLEQLTGRKLMLKTAGRPRSEN